MLDLTVEVRGSVNDILTEQRRNGARSVTRVMAATAQTIKGAWRGEITGAGLGTRLANTVRAQAYPQSGFSMNAAALVWTRASKIVGAFERGATIRAKDGLWLAIPLAGAMKSGRGGRITPNDWESRTGRALRFVYRPGRAALLVDDGRVKRGARILGRDGFSKAARGFKNRTVPIFALVPQVTLRKRLNLYTTALRLANDLPQRIVSGWRS
jgi:Family of unknown function (DUF6441)